MYLNKQYQYVKSFKRLIIIYFSLSFGFTVSLSWEFLLYAFYLVKNVNLQSISSSLLYLTNFSLFIFFKANLML